VRARRSEIYFYAVDDQADSAKHCLHALISDLRALANEWFERGGQRLGFGQHCVGVNQRCQRLVRASRERGQVRLRVALIGQA